MPYPPFRRYPLVKDPITGFLVHIDQLHWRPNCGWVSEEAYDQPGYKEVLRGTPKEHPLMRRPRKRLPRNYRR